MYDWNILIKDNPAVTGGVTHKDVEIVTNIVNLIEEIKSNSTRPTEMDNVEFTTEKGAYYPNACLIKEGGAWYVVPGGSAHTSIQEGKPSYSISGGPFEKIKLTKLKRHSEYPKILKRGFWCWNRFSAGKNNGLYFKAVVNNWVLNLRPQEKRELSCQYLTRCDIINRDKYCVQFDLYDSQLGVPRNQKYMTKYMFEKLLSDRLYCQEDEDTYWLIKEEINCILDEKEYKNIQGQRSVYWINGAYESCKIVKTKYKKTVYIDKTLQMGGV